jgi:tetrahydromethanopterin S-methyltransferase subunit E
MVETSVCESFLREREDGVHQAGDDYRLALIRRGCVGSYGANTSSFAEIMTNGDEAQGAGYPMGGGVRLRGRRIEHAGSEVRLGFDDVVFGPPSGAPVTLGIEGAVIFNATRAGRMVSTHKLPAQGMANARLVVRMNKAVRLSISSLKG